MRIMDNTAGRDISVGDVIVFGLSVTDQVVAIADYDTSAFEWGQEGTRVAKGATGVEMTLFPGQLVRTVKVV
jgi:hypothetical protein